jgi:hypothetical protein
MKAKRSGIHVCAAGLALACAWALAGCEDDDNGESAETTAIANTNATDLVDQNDAAPTPVATSVLFDKTRRILGETSFTVLTAETPAKGTVRVEASGRRRINWRATPKSTRRWSSR